MVIILLSYVMALILKEREKERNHQRASKSTCFQIPSASQNKVSPSQK